MGGCKVIVVGGMQAGVGKSTVTVGLMAALRQRGLRVQGFKVGPDLLDPLLHEAATGKPSYNLDGWMLTKEHNLSVARSLAGDADVAVVEGGDGLYDGTFGDEDGSTGQLAKWLGAPVVLVLDCDGLPARSAAALLKGHLAFDEELPIAGVILNKTKDAAHEKHIRDSIEGAGIGAPIFGALRRDDSGLGDRNKFPVIPESPKRATSGSHAGSPLRANTPKKEHSFGRNLVGGVVARLGRGVGTGASHLIPRPLFSNTVRVGIARDAAFCHYYRENLALLRECGADLVPFSPVAGDSLPQGCRGILFGGGYPELYAQELTGNRSLRMAITAFAAGGGVIYGECGGLMFLSQALIPEGGAQPRPMCGLAPFSTRVAAAPASSYAEVTIRPGCPLFPAGCRARGRVHRNSEIGPSANHWEAVGRVEGYAWRNVLMSYARLHWGGTPEMARHFVDVCKGVP
ncbi:predicted protein, partial [Micromonas commoda]